MRYFDLRHEPPAEPGLELKGGVRLKRTGLRKPAIDAHSLKRAEPSERMPIDIFPFKTASIRHQVLEPFPVG